MAVKLGELMKCVSVRGPRSQPQGYSRTGGCCLRTCTCWRDWTPDGSCLQTCHGDTDEPGATPERSPGA